MPTSNSHMGSQLSVALTACILLLLPGCSSTELEPWHATHLDAEFSQDRAEDIRSLADYLTLEEKLFAQLDEKIYAASPSGPEFSLARYSKGSLSDPGQRQPNWNRSFELENVEPTGGVLLLHGMSDSPYSLRALGQALHKQGYQVLGLRMPGHGTAPSGMLHLRWQDMAAAVRLGMEHLRHRAGEASVHIIGYSTGAALALDYALEAPPGAEPGSLVLISPAIGISPLAGLSSWKRRLSRTPGLGSLAWLQVEPEFDPYKYNSFATNAAEQVHRLTRSVGTRIQQRSQEKASSPLPPILVMKSVVDATVSTDAVVDRLLNRLESGKHELVLFDINRFAPTSKLLVADPGPLTDRLLQDSSLPFTLSLVGNSDITSRGVSVSQKPPFTRELSSNRSLQLEWPSGVLSLSHVALPFPPDDPLYGRYRGDDQVSLFLGQQALQGERGVLKISPDYLLRLRHNPFYGYLEERVLDWLGTEE